jgi:hypothetical protein
MVATVAVHPIEMRRQDAKNNAAVAPTKTTNPVQADATHIFSNGAMIAPPDEQ